MERNKKKFDEAKRQFSDKKKQYKSIQAKAANEAPLVDEDGNELPLKEKLTTDYAHIDTVEHAQAALEEAETKLNDIHSDPNVVRLYEEKKKELEETKENLDDLTFRKDNKMTELKRMQEPWEESLKKIIDKIDKRFGRYMSELGCQGEVDLRKGKPGDENENQIPNFGDYAIEIKVSFRDGVKPSVLSSRVQSGGERSVSTIMYLMAMQDMMVAPFRCVDEINQGLDDRNERLVFKRIVENSTKPPGDNGPTDHHGQYWLITPKLLPNLTDMEVEALNVICIFNGPYNMKNPQDWCTKRLIAIRKRRREELDAADESEGGNKAPKHED